jgi:hypothetical protein
LPDNIKEIDRKYSITKNILINNHLLHFIDNIQHVGDDIKNDPEIKSIIDKVKLEEEKITKEIKERKIREEEARKEALDKNKKNNCFSMTLFFEKYFYKIFGNTSIIPPFIKERFKIGTKKPTIGLWGHKKIQRNKYKEEHKNENGKVN